MLARLLFALAFALLFSFSSLAKAEEGERDPSRDAPRLTVGVRPSFVLPFGMLDRTKMGKMTGNGGGLDLDTSVRLSPTVALGLSGGHGRFAHGEDASSKFSSATRWMSTWRAGAFADVTYGDRFRPYCRFGAGYRMAVVTTTGETRGIFPTGPTPLHSSSFYDGIEAMVEWGVSIATPYVRIDPGLQLAAARMWMRDRPEQGDFLDAISLFASFGVRGTFDVARLD